MIICSPQLGLSPESNLGGEVYDREMLKALDDLGVQTIIILPFGKKYPVFKHALIYFLPTPFVYPPWIFNILILPYLFILYRKYKFDVLRVHSPYFVGPAAIFLKKFFPKIKIASSYLHLEASNKIYNIADKALIKQYSLITTISESTKQKIIEVYNIEPAKIKVIPCGVDPKYGPQDKKLGLIKKYNLENKKVLLYLGQLIERKNIPFIFEIMKLLPDNYVFIVCGDGLLRERLEKTAPDKVIFTGYISEKDKVDYYNLADVFVYPTLLEGFGLSVHEALNCSRKVIANNIEVFKEINSENLVLLPLSTRLWAGEIKKLKKKPVKSEDGQTWETAAKSYIVAIRE